ncbi:6034_t:CDS:2, partial [Cetraspora pellucida]
SIDHATMIVLAGLWSEDCKEDRSIVIDPSSIPANSSGSNSSIMSLNAPLSTRSLVGQSTSSAYVLNDHMNQLGIFFIFHDLSVRTEAAEVYSSSFRAYFAKKFPGMTESTALSKAFARQGIKIPIRKESHYLRASDDLPDQTNEIATPSASYTASNNAPNDQDDIIVEKQEPSEDYIVVPSEDNKEYFTGKWQRMSK